MSSQDSEDVQLTDGPSIEYLDFLDRTPDSSKPRDGTQGGVNKAERFRNNMGYLRSKGGCSQRSRGHTNSLTHIGLLHYHAALEPRGAGCLRRCTSMPQPLLCCQSINTFPKATQPFRSCALIDIQLAHRVGIQWAGRSFTFAAFLCDPQPDHDRAWTKAVPPARDPCTI